MRADRLLELVALLRRHGPTTADELAARLEVSRRTVLRDIEALSLSGVPVYAERGRNCGFSLLPGYRPDKAGLTADETTALFLPGGEAAADALGRGPAFRSARRKIEATLSSDVARSIGDLTSWLLVVPEGWGRAVAPPDNVRDLASVCTRHEVATLTYRKPGHQLTERLVRPIGLVLAARTWYLLAQRDDTGEQRTYRADRVVSVVSTGTQFTPTTTLVEAWRAARHSFHTREDFSIVLRCAANDLAIITDVMSLVGEVTGVTELPDGRREVLGTAAHLPRAAGLVAGLGTRAEICSPPELVDAVVAVSRENLERYAPNR